MVFPKILSQVLVLYTKKVTENTPPVYGTTENFTGAFPFCLKSDDLLTLPLKRELAEKLCFLQSLLYFFAEIQRVKRILPQIYLTAKFLFLSLHASLKSNYKA